MFASGVVHGYNTGHIRAWLPASAFYGLFSFALCRFSWVEGFFPSYRFGPNPAVNTDAAR